LQNFARLPARGEAKGRQYVQFFATAKYLILQLGFWDQGFQFKFCNSELNFPTVVDLALLIGLYYCFQMQMGKESL
jgi:hypothetical protein